jgi:hypothetical protein
MQFPRRQSRKGIEQEGKKKGRQEKMQKKYREKVPRSILER